MSPAGDATAVVPLDLFGREIDELASNALAGHRPAWDRLVGVVSGGASTRLKSLGRRDDIEDAVSQAWMAVLEGKAAYDSQRRFFPWFLAIATNKLRDLQRRSSRGPQPVEMIEGVWAAPPVDPIADLVSQERFAQVHACWEGLSESDRERIRLRFPEAPQCFSAALAEGFVEQMVQRAVPCVELARQLNTTESAIRGRIWRALDRLLGCLGLSRKSEGKRERGASPGEE